MEIITINLTTIAAFCGFIVAIGGAITYIRKVIKPIVEPIHKMREDVDMLMHEHDVMKQQLKANDEFHTDLKDDSKMMMSAIALLMKHAETGNNTGEVGKGRQELERYLINR